MFNNVITGTSEKKTWNDYHIKVDGQKCYNEIDHFQPIYSLLVEVCIQHNFNTILNCYTVLISWKKEKNILLKKLARKWGKSTVCM